VANLSPSQRLAAGLHPPPSVHQSFAAVQAAWRFYANDRITLDRLIMPMVEHARREVNQACEGYALVVMDWCQLHLNSHHALADRVSLSRQKDLGYEMLSALLISDRDGSPIAPLGMELRSIDGIYATRSRSILPAVSQLDGLEPLMNEVDGWDLGRKPVFIIDAEADSVGHYRRWMQQEKLFLVRADASRIVLHDEREHSLGQVADALTLHANGQVDYKGKKAPLFVGQTTVTLHRPARQHRVGKDRKKRHRNVPGPAITLRLIVSQVRDSSGKVLARWLLLSNLPPSVSPQQIAQWYYWRWNIESFHKLLKQAGYGIEQWQQESAWAIAKRLLVTAMCCVIVWQLARDKTPQAEPFRQVLVQLSGRQIKRGKNRPTFTAPALLAGLGILLPMLNLLEQYDPKQLQAIARAALPNLVDPKPSG